MSKARRSKRLGGKSEERERQHAGVERGKLELAEVQAQFQEGAECVRDNVGVSGISDRRRSEEALRRSEASYRSLMRSLPLGIYRSTADGTFLTINPALVEMLGYGSDEELLAVNEAAVYVNPLERDRLTSQFAHGVNGIEVEWRRKDGRPITVRLSARLARDEQRREDIIEVVAEDVTERRHLEEQLRQAQKMEAVGRLAGGIAHDFNNVLTVIAGYGDMLLETMDSGDTNRRAVGQIVKAAQRASALTRQLLAFSRKQVLQPQVLDLNAIVAGTEKMLRRLICEDIELVTALDPGLERVKADPGQIEQVIMNLAVNARDAMPQGGALTVGTANVELDEHHTRHYAGAKPGSYVMLAITDTGSGMDAETQAHVFEPFFTTKERGKGTGLGLATVYGIVNQSGGHISVHSEPGIGSTFRMYFPRVDAALQLEDKPTGDLEVSFRGRTVLLVEDEPFLRELCRDFLEERGFQVLEAADGSDGLWILRDYEGPIHLLVTDVVMPVMSGLQMVDVGSKMRPEMKVLFMSGYTDVLASTHTIVGVSHSFIQKPFAKADLLEKVSRLLHSPAPAGGQESVPGILGRPAEMKGVVAKGALPPSVSEGRTKSAHDEDSLTRRLEGKPRLLVIDDDPSVGEFVQSLAERWGYSVTIALSGATAVGIATDFRPDIALVDYKMPEMDGLETIQRLRSVAPDTSSIMITAFADLAVATQALRQSAFDFLTKPFTPIELDRALRRAIQHREVQRRERRQRSLLAVLSHELRSNLQAPLRFLSSLSSGIYGPIRDEHRQPILRALKGVATEARVVDNLLDVRYLESDQLTLRRVIYSVRALVQEVIDSFEIQIADGGVTLVWSPPSEPFLVQVDAERLKRAIANVLSNGLEHTSPGRSVEVRLCRVGSALHCCIRDEGPGIAEAYLERIFERDFQVPSSPGKAQGGLGIGLYIARQILRAHGGDVRAASVVDQGSTFAIILPCEDSSGEASSNA